MLHKDEKIRTEISSLFTCTKNEVLKVAIESSFVNNSKNAFLFNSFQFSLKWCLLENQQDFLISKSNLVTINQTVNISSLFIPIRLPITE